MSSIQTFVVGLDTPELAICARWRANAFSVLRASFEEELRSLELFASDQSHGVALVAKADGKPIGTCLLVGRCGRAGLRVSAGDKGEHIEGWPNAGDKEVVCTS
ncbi:hypothetical protein QA640_24265 [Bradyrhizobium sp. CB82]|uniref:hypothetical protein n=1 Tax=Bradyrhizobium sp. CB82 TaxID=3039159 RepID=UPI0024B25F7E|nr:hypothetical protein [Bradyrhizobium sp. CB82]WFU45373.1 hypothetical protein QA640_24265 [Bradyrhizobium sp. CB82]